MARKGKPFDTATRLARRPPAEYVRAEVLPRGYSAPANAPAARRRRRNKAGGGGGLFHVTGLSSVLTGPVPPVMAGVLATNLLDAKLADMKVDPLWRNLIQLVGGAYAASKGFQSGNRWLALGGSVAAAEGGAKMLFTPRGQTGTPWWKTLLAQLAPGVAVLTGVQPAADAPPGAPPTPPAQQAAAGLPNVSPEMLARLAQNPVLLKLYIAQLSDEQRATLSQLVASLGEALA